MKTKHWGLLLLVLVMVVAGVYSWLQGREAQQVDITGYIGGEKIGLVDDPEVKKLLMDKKKLTLNYQKAGSLDMIRLDHTGRDYLWPSSQTALDLYEKTFGKPPKSEIVFNTPIVLYTRRMVADALTKAGYVTRQDGVHFLDMKTFLPVLEKGERWESLGLPLYGSVLVSTTNPTKSNSGNMFAGLLANMINDGNVVTLEGVDAVIPRLKALIERLGSPQAAQRVAAAEALALMKEAAAPAVEALAELLGDADASVRAAAARALGWIGAPASTASIISRRASQRQPSAACSGLRCFPGAATRPSRS